LFYTDAQASNTRATTLRMTLNSTGLGVGALPLGVLAGRGNVTINGSTDAILALGNAGVLAGYIAQSTSKLDIVSLGATFVRILTNGSERYKIDSTGVATWSNVGGVAGTAMTLDSTGLGVGASPLGKFDAYSTGADTNVFIRSDTTRLGQIVFRDNADSGNQGRVKYDHSTDTLSLYSNGNENLFLNSSGNVGIGVTPSSWSLGKALNVNSLDGAVLWGYSGAAVFGNNFRFSGGYLYETTAAASRYSQSSGSHQWFNAPSGTAGNAITFTQAMTLDASGNLLVGKTALSDTTVGWYVRPNGITTATMSSSVDTDTSYQLYSTGASAYRFYVGMGGTVYATNTTISAISDARLKENVQDIDVGLDAILALKPRKFDWKTGKGKNIKGDRGFIAQEFETVFPNLIDEWKDPAPEGEAPYKSVRQDLIPVLVKAIQELAAEVNALKNA